MNSSQHEMNTQEKKEMTFIPTNTNIVLTMHFISEVTADREPSLTRYQRVIVNVLP